MTNAMTTLNVYKVELHVPAGALTPNQLRKIRAAGGMYSHVRGFETTRYVTLPAAASAAVNMVLDAARAYDLSLGIKHKTVVVFKCSNRPYGVPSWVIVHSNPASLAHAVSMLDAAWAKYEAKYAKVA